MGSVLEKELGAIGEAGTAGQETGFYFTGSREPLKVINREITGLYFK